jgi:hypothetical protein
MKSSETRIRRLLALGAVGAAVATVVNALIYAFGRAADVDYVVTRSGERVERVALVDVVSLSLMSFAVGFIAVAVAVWCRRRGSGAERIGGRRWPVRRGDPASAVRGFAEERAETKTLRQPAFDFPLNSLRAFQVVGGLLAVISTYGDFFIDGTTAAKATLALMHIVVGAAYITSLQAARSASVTRAAATSTAATRLEPVAA